MPDPHGGLLCHIYPVLLLFLAEVRLCSSACPSSCTCSVPTEVHCTFRYLSNMPTDLQPTVRRINLGYNSLTVLREHELAGLEHLELLMLHSNTIHTVEDRAFLHLKALQVLKMSYNGVKELRKETFQGLGNLLRLHMDNNRIEFIHPEAFYGLSSLQFIHLEGNLIQQLHPDTFVTLRHSQIFQFSSIRTIYLSENALTTVPATLFDGCYQLENLFLSGNPWSCDCRMDWIAAWIERNPGVLKCKRDRKFPGEHLCPVCESPLAIKGSNVVHLSVNAYRCSPPWIHPRLKQRNITTDENSFSPVFPKDFIAPIGNMELNLTDQFHNDASVSCVVQTPSRSENLNVTQGDGVTTLSATVSTSLVCSIDYEHIRTLWSLLASYSDFPMRLERGMLLTKSPGMIYRYKQVRSADDETYSGVEAEVKAMPAWLMQGVIGLLLDRSTTTYSALHVKYQSRIEMNIESDKVRRDRYTWAMIKKDNRTKTEFLVLSGGVTELNCQAFGEPKPSMEWILPDGSKVRAPYYSEDQRIVISDNGKLMIRATDLSDAGVYHCIATNYLDADVLSFRVTVLSPDVEESDVNGVQISRSVGESLFLDCETEGTSQASIHWMLPDHTIIDQSIGHRKLFPNGTLGIRPLTHRDRGFYRCVAANPLGVDLLFSQLTVSSKAPKIITLTDVEGSGEAQLNTEVVRQSQESRTITSNRPYPRLGPSLHQGPSNRRGSSRRSGWSRRVFNKASRKVDPKILADYIRRSQKNSSTNDEEDLGPSDKSNANESEAGSGATPFAGDASILVASVTENPENIYGTAYFLLESNQSKVTATTENVKPSTASYAMPDATPVVPSVTLKNSAFSKDDTTFSNSATNSPEGSTSKSLQPVTLKFAVTESMDVTELQFSGDVPESATKGVPRSQDPNVTSMNPVVHTSIDPQTQTTFTAITTTEREQDEITFHTTQRITSPHLPPGSTIISHQQIHIIPPDKKRPGRRRNFPNRRRIIRPNRITDIQTFLDKLKSPTVKSESNATIPYVVEVTTNKIFTEQSKVSEELRIVNPTTSGVPMAVVTTTTTTTTTPFVTSPVTSLLSKKQVKSEASSEATSAGAPEQKTPHNPMRKVPTVMPTSTTTKPSKILHGKIPWDRLFGRKESQREIFKRLRKPTKPSTTTQSTRTSRRTTTPPPSIQTMTTTAPTKIRISLPTAESLAAPMTASPPRNQDSSKISSEDFSGSSSAEHSTSDIVVASFTTGHPSGNDHTTVAIKTVTTPTYGSRLSTSTASQFSIIPIQPALTTTIYKGNTIETSGSGGSGGSAERPWRNQQPGFHRWRLRGRRPKKKSSTTAPTTTRATTFAAPQTTSRVLRTPTREAATSSNPKTSAVTESTQTLSLFYRTMTTPYTTLQSRIQRKDQSTSPEDVLQVDPTRGGTYQTQIPTIKPIRYKDHVEPPSARDEAGAKERTATEGAPAFGMVTVLPPSSSAGISIPYDRRIAYIPTSSNRKNEPLKPTIVGGNAASFTVQSNADAVLPCEARGDPKPMVSWKRVSSSTGGTLTIKGKVGKFELLRNGTLFIQNANIKDRGQYLCLAENPHGTAKLLVTLSVVAHPSRILEPKVREMKVHSGKAVEMTCRTEGTPAPVISWILANHTHVRGQSHERARVVVTPQGTLVIRPVSVYDRGHYKCIASNLAGADTASVRLQVVAAPPVILEEKRQLIRADAGQNLWIPCTAQGDPQPTTHWVLMDRTAVTIYYVNTRVSAFPNGTLSMKNLQVSDSGKYECIATSSTGSERRVVTLTVERTESPPQITETSERRTALEYGSQLRLNCSATGNPKPRILWRLPSKALVDQWHRMGSRIHVLQNGTLVIDSVSEKDAGDYLCVARSKAGDDLQLLKVTVSMKPAKIEAKIVGKTQVPYGKDLKVDCKASGAPVPEISWGLPDGTLVNSALQSDGTKGSRPKRYVLFDNGTLYLNQVSMDEEGDYTCYAENTLGKDEMHVHITVVTAAPRIRPSPLTYSKIKPGGNIRFDCEAVGEPKPKIFWLLPSSDMIAASNERYLMHVNGSLDIRSVTLSDAGEYVCMARNAAGDQSKVYKLEIDGNPPVINGFYQNRTVVKDTAEKFSRKFIDCKVKGEPPPKITWVMPHNIFLSAPYFGSRVNVHPNGTLEIRNVRPSDTAEFICMARNDGGEAVMVVQLEVTNQLMRPIFKNPFNERLVTRLGKTTVLNCSADGNPPPDMIWTLPNGTQLNTGPILASRYQLGNDGTFTIYNPSKEDAGKYRCAAKNKVGYIEKLILLEVGQKPYILTRPRGIIRSMSGEPLFLHCLADGSPRPNIVWTVPGGHVLGHPQTIGRLQLMDNGTLVIHHTKLHDRGNYVCRAKNNAGEAMLTVPVMIVAYPPRITSGPPATVKTVAGSPVHLNCIAIGIPKPEITWMMPDQSVLSTAGKGRSTGSELLHPQGTLIIQRPMREDSGLYKCVANNNLGTDTRVTFMRVI